MPNTYSVGDLVQLTATFTAVATGATINPTTVDFYVKKPNGTTLTPIPSNPSLGVYTTQVSIDEAGEWLWRVTGTGAAQAASAPDDGHFQVAANAF